MKRILNYPGSKWGMSEMIISLMPEHKNYLEPFAGSLAVFFNKNKVLCETINDLDGRLINLYKQMREQPEKLAQLVYLTPYSRQEQVLSREVSEDSLEDARRMMVLLWFSIGGKTSHNSSFKRNTTWKGPYNTQTWSKVPLRILEAAERLKNVQVENRPAVQLIKEFDDPETLIYIDPPYLPELLSNSYYKYEMVKDEHVELLQIINKSKAKIILSGYESQLYSDSLKGWKKFIVSTATFTGKKQDEVLWLNYDPPGQLDLFEDIAE
ncbi:DNA adenine methylase [Lactococcus lactis]|uniref:DNA adenine methylase n=1 Tax=Lactococcus lactis TaxID=1358 RepID=UPI002416E6A8|nr:DNA adenine methylase [Lactococcus lactis]MDG4974285.1 DNA adenine methylase [Lactococcus lactis]